MPCDRQAAHSINLFQDAGQATKGQHGLLLTVCLWLCTCKVQEQPLQSATAAEDSTQGSLSSSWHLLSGCPATCTYHITLGGVDTVSQGLYRNPLHWHFCYSALTVVIAAVDLLGQPKVCHTHRHVIP